jgi:hypothetical protein
MNFSFVKQNYSQFVVLLGGHQNWSAFVLDEERDEFRRFGFAGVPPHHVNIVGAFIEGLACAFIYVPEGSIVMQVRGGKEVTLTPRSSMGWPS